MLKEVKIVIIWRMPDRYKDIREVVPFSICVSCALCLPCLHTDMSIHTNALFPYLLQSSSDILSLILEIYSFTTIFIVSGVSLKFSHLVLPKNTCNLLMLTKIYLILAFGKKTNKPNQPTISLRTSKAHFKVKTWTVNTRNQIYPHSFTRM